MKNEAMRACCVASRRVLLSKITLRLVPAATVRALSITIHSLLYYQGLIGNLSGYIEGLSDDVKKTIEGLKGVNAEHLAIFKQFKKESLELESKVRSRVQSDHKPPTKATSLYRFLGPRLS